MHKSLFFFLTAASIFNSAAQIPTPQKSDPIDSSLKITTVMTVDQDDTNQTSTKSAKQENGSDSAISTIYADNSDISPTPDSSQASSQIKDSINSTSIVSDEKNAPPSDQNAVIQEMDEDLILEGGEENILAPVTIETPVQLPSPPDSSVTTKTAVSDSGSLSIAGEDSLSKQQKTVLPHYPSSAMPKVEEDSKPLAIEKTLSINFAKNYKEYRSPKLAILLSLLVPGVGQAYSHNKIKTGIFGFVEVAFIAAGAIVGYQGNKKMKNARSFADNHYNFDSLTSYYNSLEIKNPEIDSQVFISYISYDDFKKEAEAGNKSQSYYNHISHEVSPYIQGWDDVSPRFDENFDPINTSDSGKYIVNEDPDSSYLVYFVNNNGDTSEAQFGFSPNQKLFNQKLSKANSYFRWSKSLFTMLLINHVVSAIDAGITAKAFNDKLLGKKSVWQRFNLNETIVHTPVGPAQGFALEVRF